MDYKTLQSQDTPIPVQPWGALTISSLFGDCLPIEILRSPFFLLPDMGRMGLESVTPRRPSLDVTYRGNTGLGYNYSQGSSSNDFNKNLLLRKRQGWDGNPHIIS